MYGFYRLTLHMFLTKKDKFNVFSNPILMSRKLLNIIDSCLFHLNPLLVQTLQQIHKLNTVRKINSTEVYKYMRQTVQKLKITCSKYYIGLTVHRLNST